MIYLPATNEEGQLKPLSEPNLTHLNFVRLRSMECDQDCQLYWIGSLILLFLLCLNFTPLYKRLSNSLARCFTCCSSSREDEPPQEEIPLDDIPEVVIPQSFQRGTLPQRVTLPRIAPPGANPQRVVRQGIVQGNLPLEGLPLGDIPSIVMDHCPEPKPFHIPRATLNRNNLCPPAVHLKRKANRTRGMQEPEEEKGTSLNPDRFDCPIHGDEWRILDSRVRQRRRSQSLNLDARRRSQQRDMEDCRPTSYIQDGRMPQSNSLERWKSNTLDQRRSRSQLAVQTLDRPQLENRGHRRSKSGVYERRRSQSVGPERRRFELGEQELIYRYSSSDQDSQKSLGRAQRKSLLGDKNRRFKKDDCFNAEDTL